MTKEKAAVEPVVASPEGMLAIKPPRYQTIIIPIQGTSPYVQHRFSEKAKAAMRSAMLDPAQRKRGKKKEPRDFEADYERAKHVSTEGWNGIPASAFRSGAISACRLIGFKMTLAKLSLFVEPDGFDRLDTVPLVQLYGEPEKYEAAMRPALGNMDIRVRPMWRKWSAKVRVRYDLDQFNMQDVVNLLIRVGQQVGIGEGRPDSRDSAGIGFGMFEIAGQVIVIRKTPEQ